MVIDDKLALKNMAGEVALYRELLEYSLELEQERKHEINESFEKRDWKEYAIRVHALKGGMRSLGIEELALVANAQEIACAEERVVDIETGHIRLMREYDRAHRSIEEYLLKEESIKY